MTVESLDFFSMGRQKMEDSRVNIHEIIVFLDKENNGEFSPSLERGRSSGNSLKEKYFYENLK
jgi:hypothetical protein